MQRRVRLVLAILAALLPGGAARTLAAPASLAVIPLPVPPQPPPPTTIPPPSTSSPEAASSAPTASAIATPTLGPPEIISFSSQPGAAAFRRGGFAVLIFDTSEIPDLTGLRSAPLFAGASLLSLQDAQVVSIPLPAGDSLGLEPVPGGWQVMPVPAWQPDAAPMQNDTSTVEFPMKSANQSIIVTDPLTGADLLVGTVMQAGDAADFVASGPGYAVLPAWLGVVVAPLADTLNLNASLKGFELVSDAPGGLPLGLLPAAATAAPASGPGADLPLPRGDTAALWRRMQSDQRAVALLPPLGRLNAQITLAQDMVALGLGPETTAVLDTAVLENPAAADNGQIAALRAIARVLAHRSRDADFTTPGIVPGPELAFWQAVALMDAGKTAQAAPGLIAGLPLFESYPAPLRDNLASAIAEALADNNDIAPARQLCDSEPDNSTLDLARARILEDEGKSAAALNGYQAVARGLDNRQAAIANARVVELRLAAGKLTPRQAAAALDAQLFDWRGSRHERHMRLRIATLWAEAGQWPEAFEALSAAKTRFPAAASTIDTLRAALFARMLNDPGFAALSAIDTIAVLQQNEDLIPPGPAGAQVLSLLAQRLGALDLPGAAAPMLSRLIQGQPQGPARAALGATLAQVDLDAGSPTAALADLQATDATGLPSDLAARRSMLTARAQAAAGNAIAAVSVLSPPPAPAPVASENTPALAIPVSPQLLATQAQIAEQAGQWPEAEQALGALVNQTIPTTGPLTPAQESLLLRLATAAAHDNDSSMLTALNGQYGNRVGADAAGQMFQTLTAPPLTADQGLNQALREIMRLQALPAMVNAVAGPADVSPTPARVH